MGRACKEVGEHKECLQNVQRIYFLALVIPVEFLTI
jgi:hypothetical protein